VIWGFDGTMDYTANLLLLFIDFKGMKADDLTKKTEMGNLKTRIIKT